MLPCCFYILQSSLPSCHQSLRFCTVFISCLVPSDISVHPLPRCHEDWHIALCVCPPLSHLMLISFPPFLLLFSHRVELFVTPWTAAHQASLSLLIYLSLPRFMSIELVMPSNHLCPLVLLLSIFPSIRVFSNEKTCSHQVAKVLEFQH